MLIIVDIRSASQKLMDVPSPTPSPLLSGPRRVVAPVARVFEQGVQGDAEADIQQGTLSTILAYYKPPELSLYAIYPSNRHLAVKVRLFIDFLVERFGQRPYWDLVE